MDELTLYVAYAMVFAGVFIFMRTMFQQEDTRSAKELLGESERLKKSSNSIIKFSRPIFSRYVVPIVATMKIDKTRKELKRKIIAAGMADEFTPDELYAFKFFMIFGAPLFTLGVNYLGEFDFHPLIYILISVMGFYYPDLMLSESKKARQKAALRAMPFIVDLLALSTEAGLDFLGAIGKVCEKASPGPLVDEFKQILKDIQIGSSRSEALKEMAVRLDMKEISSFVAILISSDQMGASIGKTLRQQSEMIRNQRFMMAEKIGAAAAQKLMGPMFMFILPAILIAIFGPAFFSFQGAGGLF